MDTKTKNNKSQQRRNQESKPRKPKKNYGPKTLCYRLVRCFCLFAFVLVCLLSFVFLFFVFLFFVFLFLCLFVFYCFSCFSFLLEIAADWWRPTKMQQTNEFVYSKISFLDKWCKILQMCQAWWSPVLKNNPTTHKSNTRSHAIDWVPSWLISKSSPFLLGSFLWFGLFLAAQNRCTFKRGKRPTVSSSPTSKAAHFWSLSWQRKSKAPESLTHGFRSKPRGSCLSQAWPRNALTVCLQLGSTYQN